MGDAAAILLDSTRESFPRPGTLTGRAELLSPSWRNRDGRLSPRRGVTEVTNANRRDNNPESPGSKPQVFENLNRAATGPVPAAPKTLQRRTTGFRSVPRPSISTSTMSPGWSQTGGFRAIPTPGGVPVKIRSPGSRVKIRDR